MIASTAPTSRPRDRRIDFFRGLALMFIFIDHIPDNRWSYATLKNFGFSDASEVFVLLSGYSAALAYRLGAQEGSLYRPVYRSIRRAGVIYLWHLGIFAASALLLYAAAAGFAKPSYVTNIWLQNLAADPVTWIFKALTLTYQPNQMNILPLYVALMLWFPVLMLLFRRGVVPAISVSILIWAAASHWKVNFPANTPGEGWFFNPFAWQLLFTTGATAAVLSRTQDFTGRSVALALASTYVLFSFLYAAPWVPISWLPDQPLLPPDLIGAVSKPDLSAWRFLHVLALAYVAGSLIPASAPWLDSSAARVVALCGRHGIEMFALGTLLSFAGWIVLEEAGTTATLEFLVTAAGIATMAAAALHLTRVKGLEPQQLPAAGPA